MNGTFLIAVGAAWNHARLSERAARVAFGAAIYGTYANWVTTTLAAVFGTAAMTPVASGSHLASPWQESVVSVAFVSVTLAMLVSAVLLLIGFRRSVSAAATG